LGVLFGFLTAIAVGLLLACALFVLAYAQLDIIRFQSDISTRRSRLERPDTQSAVLAVQGHRAKIVELSGFLFFGSSSGLRTRLQDIMAAAPALKWLIMDFRFVTGIDVSTRHMLRRIAADCAARQVDLVLTGLDAATADAIRSAEGISQTLPTLEDGIEHIEQALIHEASGTHPEGSAVFDQVMQLFAAQRLAGYAAEVVLDAGDTVVSQAANSRDIYLVKSGRLQISSLTPQGHAVVVAHVQPGSVVGEIANYTGGARTAQIVASDRTTLIRIKMADFAALEAEHPEVAATFHRLMAQVMAHRLARTTKLLRDLGV